MDRLASLRVCAYNVLAQNLATSKYFPSAKQALKVAKRYPLLRQRFQSINADIICVSEAFSDVVDMLQSLGYEVRYIQRHSKTYGNAIAWRGELLEVEREATATFNDCADAIPSFPIRVAGSGVSIVRSDFITENIAMFMQFRLKQHADSRVCVCSTHLYWDPSKDPVKVAQAQMSASSSAAALMQQPFFRIFYPSHFPQAAYVRGRFCSIVRRLPNHRRRRPEFPARQRSLRASACRLHRSCWSSGGTSIFFKTSLIFAFLSHLLQHRLSLEQALCYLER